MNHFNLKSHFTPAGDQNKAIANIVESFKQGTKHHVLLGVTGSGKTFTMANVIAQLNKSALIIAPNKTLAAQLYAELRSFFPEDPVGFFISYYDYYQPEAYIPSTDTYIAKDSSINEDIDKMRHECTRNLFEKERAIVVASVSCIYGLGSPAAYAEMVVGLKVGQEIKRDQLLKSLIEIQYSRDEMNFTRGCFRVRGDVIDILPAHKKEEGIRIELFGDHIETISIIDAMTGSVYQELEEINIYPNSHYVTQRKDIKKITQEILTDLGIRLRELKAQNKLAQMQRLEQRTLQDVETLEQLGFCPGIENYSRYLTGARPGSPPPTLIDYFGKDFLTIIDESHITIPQIGGMYRGDRARKQTLVEFGFRLPSALDNRPLNYQEFLERNVQILHVSATPSVYDLEIAKDSISEQIIRPTGLLDPHIVVKKASTQIEDLLEEIKQTVQQKGRVLVITLTKKMAEELTTYYRDRGIKIKYLHSNIDSLERAHLLRALRLGEFDVLVGINLLREGLDLPEVTLVGVLDADKEGFLRSKTSLIQIVGRAARNSQSRVIFYAEKITSSMSDAMKETERRRFLQEAYNIEHHMTPQTVIKEIPDDLMILHGFAERKAEVTPFTGSLADRLKELSIHSEKELQKTIKKKTTMMKQAAGRLDFEKACLLREEIKELNGLLLAFGELF